MEGIMKKGLKNRVGLRKIVTYSLLLIILLTSLILINNSVSAHGPSSVTLEYNYTAQQLNVTITHFVGNPNSHYIYKIEISKNSNLIDTKSYSSQPVSGTFTYTYDISANDGDVLEAKAYCNQGGDNTGQITADAPAGGEKNIELTITPFIDIINEEESQKINVTITSGNQTLEGVKLTITADFGEISKINELNDGKYEFLYASPEVNENKFETINIVAKKEGYNDNNLKIQFTIKDSKTSNGVKPTMDGIISEDEYEHSVELDGDNYVLHWRIEENKIRIAMVAKTTGWVAIGFDPKVRMKDADMIIGWVTSEGEVKIIDAYSKTEAGSHPPDVDLGGTDDILAYGGSEGNGKTTIEFERFLSTDDEYDKDIPKDDDLKIIWAFGSNDDDDYTSQHSFGKRGSGTINLATGEYKEEPELWFPHMVFMILGLVLILIGVLIAMIFKGKRWWLKVHRALNLFGAIFAIIGISIAIYMVEVAGTGHIRYLHSILGIITIVLLIKSPILGFAISSSGKKSKNLKTYHRWIGRIAIIFMLVTIVSGLSLKGIL